MRATLASITSGTYDPRAAAGIVLVIAGVILDIAGHADGLPPRLAPYVALVEPWARLVVLVGGALAAQGKSLVVPKAPQ